MMSSLFTLPLPVYQQSLPTRDIPTQSARKRKRRTPSERITPKEPPHDSSQLQSLRTHEHQSLQSAEYLAVLTPEERTQYRLAGQPLDQEPPGNPFPHAAVAPPLHNNHDGPKLHQLKKGIENKPASGAPATAPAPAHNPTLHLQHLSAITTVLHRCLMEQDYTRASRALGLILRDSIGGHSLDIRYEGRWGVGAEILLKCRSHGQPATVQGAEQRFSRRALFFTREGFEKAKRYYERLVVQYPFSKPHSAAVNALDFYQALFGLWIYLVHEECKPKSMTSSPDDLEQLELDQAREIASRMDACMSGVPFSDDLELMRLRGMVALWVADLTEACSVKTIASLDGDSFSLGSTPLSEIPADVIPITLGDRAQRAPWPDSRTEAAQARRVAQNMFAKVKGGGIIDDGSDE